MRFWISLSILLSEECLKCIQVTLYTCDRMNNMYNMLTVTSWEAETLPQVSQHSSLTQKYSAYSLWNMRAHLYIPISWPKPVPALPWRGWWRKQDQLRSKNSLHLSFYQVLLLDLSVLVSEPCIPFCFRSENHLILSPSVHILSVSGAGGGVWWVGPGWMPSAHQAALSLPQLDKEEEI